MDDSAVTHVVGGAPAGTRLGVPVSALDVVPVPVGTSASEAIGHAGELAELLDRLGLRRLWYAGHHGMPGIASSRRRMCWWRPRRRTPAELAGLVGAPAPV